MLNISRIKGNQTMKFGHLIEYNKISFFKNHAKNEARRLGPNLFFSFFKKALYAVKTSGLGLSF